MQDRQPLVMWQLTRACGAACSRCPAGARSQRDELELSTYEAYKTIDQIVALAPREVVITGGDPLERKDLPQLIDYARRRGLAPSVAVSGTPLLTQDAIRDLAEAGLTRVVLALDAVRSPDHERVRGSSATFAPALLAARWAHLSRLSVEVSTLATPFLIRHFTEFVDLLEDIAVEQWSIFFLVPVASSREVEMLTAAEVEELFTRMDRLAGTSGIRVRTFEAPHFVRHSGAIEDDVVFINDRGGLSPSLFLPIEGGNIRRDSLSHVYRQSDVFRSLRQRDLLHGKCGRCDFRVVCGGSRARAYAMTGDLFAADPLCAYQPSL